jgi:HEAT repeat protein
MTLLCFLAMASQDSVDRWKRLLPPEIHRVLDDALGFPQVVETIERGSPERRQELIEQIAYLGDPGLVPLLKEWQARSDDAFRPWPILVRAVCRDREALPELVALLRHPEKKIMGNAYALLYMMGDGSLAPALAPLLRESGDARLRAYYLLDKHAPSEAAAVAREMIADPRKELKFSGARTLSRVGDPAAVEPLLGLAREEKNPETLAALAQWLKPFDDARILSFLGGLLESREPKIARIAVETARGLDAEKGRPILLNALAHWSEDGVAIPAIEILEKQERLRWISEARKLLTSPEEAARANAAHLLGRVKDAESRDALIRLSADKSALVQMRSLEALARLDAPAAATIAEKLFASSSLQVRMVCANVLSLHDRDRATPFLLKMLDSDKDYERGYALKTLHGFKHPDAENHARRLFKEGSESVKLVALSTLVERGIPDALDLTLEFFPQTQELASYVAWIIEQHFTDARFLPRFARALAEPKGDLKVRMMAAVWLGYFAGGDAVAALVPGLSDPELRVRLTVALALARSGERERVVPFLLKLTEDPAARQASELWFALGWTRDPRAKAALLAGLEAKPDKGPGPSPIVVMALEGLGIFGDPDSLPVLRRCLMHRDDRLRDTALFAAAKVGDPFARRRFLRRVEDAWRGPAGGRPEWFGELVSYLGHIREPESLKLLAEILGGPDPALKIKSVSALQEIASREAMELLVGALSDASYVGGYFSPQRFVREVALKALVALTRRRVAGSIDEQIDGWKKWWEAEGRAAYVPR